MTDGHQISLERVFPKASSNLQKFFRSAAESGLEAIDFYTIKDLQDLSGYHDEELARLLVCLFLALREGSVCIDLAKDGLLRRLEGVLDPESATASIDAMLQALKTKRYPDLIGGNDDESKPLIRRTVNKRELLYFQKYLRHERALRVLLEQRLTMPQPTLLPKALQEFFNATLTAHVAAGIQFSAEQKLAIALALQRNFVVISGGPGTGKTSVVFALMNCLVRSGTPPDRILLACPTGRAAQRLTESLRAGAAKIADSAALSGLTAQTLHRLLGYNPKFGTFSHHRENQLPADVLIVDEVSMMDVVLMSRFLEAAPPGAKVILLGDKDQLPSVDAGSVLADLMPADGQPAFSSATVERLRELTGVEILRSGRDKALLADGVVILKKNFRSQQHITDVARAINNIGEGGLAKARQIVQTLPALKLKSAPAPADAGTARYVWPRAPELKQAGHEQPGGCFLLNHPHQHDEWREILDAWADFHYVGAGDARTSYRELVQSLELPDDAEYSPEIEAQLAKIFSVVNNARVLTLLRDGMWGCQGVNLHLARRLATRERRGTAGAFPGAPILITANDYTLNLFNGDVGVALQTRDRALRVVFERQDDTGRRHCLSLPLDILPQHELAFAMTVHKSQGSEYGQVLLAIPPEGGQRLQNRQLVYTAITRARQVAVCYGSPSVLSAAISRGLERCSGLSSELA
jgi:exodeoxyribonuclease V alpha subunit